MLSDNTIKKLCIEQDLITPFKEEALQPCSYDLTLDDIVIKQVFTGRKVDLVKESVTKDFAEIRPGEFVLASTIEKVNLPNTLCAKVEGKSSIGRLGLFIQNAGHIDPGFSGNITLELFNAGEYIIDLKDIKSICQITFSELDRPSTNPYQGHYQEQEGVTESWMKLKE